LPKGAGRPNAGIAPSRPGGRFTSSSPTSIAQRSWYVTTPSAFASAFAAFTAASIWPSVGVVAPESGLPCALSPSTPKNCLFTESTLIGGQPRRGKDDNETQQVSCRGRDPSNPPLGRRRRTPRRHTLSPFVDRCATGPRSSSPARLALR